MVLCPPLPIIHCVAIADSKVLLSPSFLYEPWVAFKPQLFQIASAFITSFADCKGVSVDWVEPWHIKATPFLLAAFIPCTAYSWRRMMEASHKAAVLGHQVHSSLSVWDLESLAGVGSYQCRCVRRNLYSMHLFPVHWNFQQRYLLTKFVYCYVAKVNILDGVIYGETLPWQIFFPAIPRELLTYIFL